MTLRTPQYPYEISGKSERSKNLLQSPHKGLLRSHRLHGYAHPPVISSTQQLLCLTPSKGGIITMSTALPDREETMLPEVTSSNNDVITVKRFNEDNQAASSSGVVATVITRAGKSGDVFRTMRHQARYAIRRQTPTNRAFPLSSPQYVSNLIRPPNRRSEIKPIKSGVSMKSNSKSETIKPKKEKLPSDKAKLWQPRTMTSLSTRKYTSIDEERNLKWPIFQLNLTHSNIAHNFYPSNFHQLNFTDEHHSAKNQTRQMAPVLRVIPALPPQSKNDGKNRNAPKSAETGDGLLKRVRFSDQIGQPLIRNATPNYKRKHSYILRWLETAGRPPKTVQLT